MENTRLKIQRSRSKHASTEASKQANDYDDKKPLHQNMQRAFAFPFPAFLSTSPPPKKRRTPSSIHSPCKPVKAQTEKRAKEKEPSFRLSSTQAAQMSITRDQRPSNFPVSPFSVGDGKKPSFEKEGI